MNTLELIQPYTVVDNERLMSLMVLADDIEKRGIEGDVVECGVARGGSAAILTYASGRHCWLYDSCAGLPVPTGLNETEALDYVGANQTSPEIIAEAFEAIQIPQSQYTLRVGWFHDTLTQEPLPKKIALLHIDADWFESVYLSLAKLYDLVSPGGIVVLDDYGYWTGCRKAFHMYFAVKGNRPEITRVGDMQVWWRKP